MSNSIGTVEIQVLANLAQMVSDLGKGQAEWNKFGESIKRSVDSAKDALVDLAAAVGVAFSVDKLVEFGRSAVEQAEKVQNLSQSLSTTTQSVQALSFAAQVNGGTLDQVAGAMEKLQKSQILANSGNAKMIEGFRALGVEITDSNGQLKSADALYQDVAEHLSRAADSPTKVAVAVQLMGRSAAESIPFFNALGANAEEYREQAEKLGVVLDNQSQITLMQYKEQLNLLSAGMGGVANSMMVALAPALTEITARVNIFLASGDPKKWGEMFGNTISDVIHFLDNMSLGFTTTFATIDRLWNQWKVGMQILGMEVKAMFQDVAANITNNLIDVASTAAKFSLVGYAFKDRIDVMANAAKLAKPDFAALEVEVTKLQQGVQNYNAASLDAVRSAAAETQANRDAADSVKQINTVLAAYHNELGQKGADKAKIEMDALRALDAIEKGLNATGTTQVFVQQQLQKATDDITTSFDRATAGVMHFNAEAGNTHKTFADVMLAARALTDQLDSMGDDGKFQKAIDSYVQHIDAIQIKYNELAKAAGEDSAKLAEAFGWFTDALDKNDEALQKQDALISGEVDQSFAKLATRYQEQVDGITGMTRAQQVEKESLQATMQIEQELQALYGKGYTISDEYRQRILAMAAAHVDEMNAAKQAAEIEKQFQGIATSGFDSLGKSISDFATGGIKNMKSFEQSVMGDFKQFIAAMIQEMLKLTVFNGIINQLFNLNGTAGQLPTFGNMGAPSGAGSILNFAANAAGGGGASSIGGASASGSNPLSSIMGMTSNSGGIMNWLGGVFGTSGGMSIAQNAAAGGIDLSAGAGAAVPLFDSGGATLAGNTAMGGIDLSAGAGAGSAAPAAGGGFMPILGGVAAGIGEYNAAGGGAGGLAGAAAYGIGTYAIGTALTAGVTAAAAGGISAGLAAGFAAIPVVGWIALAAMAVNMISGGKLFGTAWKPTGSEMDVNVGAGGASIKDTTFETRQRAFFGGTAHKQVNDPVPQQQQDALQGFYTSLQNSIAIGAHALGEQTGDMITGSWKETFDKHGKMTSQMSTIMGQTFNEPIDQFEQRIEAVNMLGLLPVSQNVFAITKQFQGSAASLLDVASMLVEAQVDINHHMSLLGGDNGSLADIVSIVSQLQKGGESMADAYVRLQTETMTTREDMSILQIDTGRTGAGFVQLADDMATAAGGVQNLDAMWKSFFKEFYTSSDQATMQAAYDRKKATDVLTAIGEDPTESLAQFKQDFLAALPTMTGDQIVAWLQAGAAMYAASQDAQSMADALTTGQQQYAAFEEKLYGDSFVTAVTNAMNMEQQQIDTANKLAIAAGLAGASQEDLARITLQGTIQIEQAMAQLTQGIYADITSLYGAASTSPGYGPNNELLNTSAIQANSQAQAQAQHAQTLSEGYDLLQKLGDFAFMSGQSVDDVLKQFGLSADQLASTLGISSSSVKGDIDSAKSTAASLTTMAAATPTQTGLLQDILAAIQGKPLPFDLTTLGAPLILPVSGDKVTGPRIVSAHGATNAQPSDKAKDMSASVKEGTSDMVSQLKQAVGFLQRQTDALEKMVRTGANTQRNTRGVF